jgi:hypothetical protein
MICQHQRTNLACFDLVGQLIDKVSYAPVFVLVVFMHLASALFVMTMIRRIEPLNEQ